MGKAHGAQKLECIFIHEDFEHRATQNIDCAVG